MIQDIGKDGTVSAYERIALYGDGFFTTIKVTCSIAELADMHLARLKLAAQRLEIEVADWHSLHQHIHNRANDIGNGVLKVVVSRGVGGRGYGTTNLSHAHCFFYESQMPKHYSLWQREGIALNCSSVQLARQPLLAGIKHLNRLEQVLIKQRLQQSAADDCIVCDSEGFVIESSAANVFWRKGRRWFTPDLSQSGVEGVMRNHISTTFKTKNIELIQCLVRPEELLEADEIFICNCLMKWVPVKSFTFKSQTKHWQRTGFTIDTIMQEVLCQG